VELELVRRVDGRLRLKQALQPLLDAFDVLLIDTPPTLGILTQAPLVASTDLLMPVDVGYFSLEGMRQLLDENARVRQGGAADARDKAYPADEIRCADHALRPSKSHPPGEFWGRDPPHRDSCEC